MFTIKLFRKDGCQHTVINALWYEVFGTDGSYSIVAYNDTSSSHGVSFRVKEDEFEERVFQQCYIENIAGKTISSYRAYSKNADALPASFGIDD